MNMISAQEIKRRGISAVEKLAAEGPVYVVKDSRAQYVVMSESDYRQMIHDLADARLAASEADVKAGRVQSGSAAQLMREIHEDE